MRFTDRDRKILRDVVLSRVLSRDQLIRLGYFQSTCRANARLLLLAQARVLRVLKTPFFGQHLYAGGANAAHLAGPQVIEHFTRTYTPYLVQHSLAVTETRLSLLRRDYAWRFEAQVRHQFTDSGQRFDLRPDGMGLKPDRALFVEVDLGHTSSRRFRDRIDVYRRFLASGEFEAVFNGREPAVLVVTTGKLRARHLQALAGPLDVPPFRVVAAKELGVSLVGGWS